MPKTEKNPVAVQANSLISARYCLSLGEQRMVLMMISKISYDDEAFQGYEIPIKELIDTLQINVDCAYREAQTITDKLLKRILRIPRSDGSLLKCNWIAEAIHQPGSVTLTPAPSLRPYLLELRECFTVVPLAQIKGLRSQYSVRIYMLLRQHTGLGNFQLTIDEFRAMFTLEQKYKKFNELRRWVLEVAQKELNAKADLSFALETGRTGKFITRLKFIIIKNDKIKKTKDIDAKKSPNKSEPVAVEPKPIPQNYEFPEYWLEFLDYVYKNDPILLRMIENEGPEFPIVKYEYINWEKKFKGY